MKNKNIEISYASCKVEELDEIGQKLVSMAKEATYTSYSPYSNFCVGAALQTSGNHYVAGSNQENAAFGAGTCAERCALFHAHAEYPQEFVKTIAIAARGTDGQFTENPISPCGICRQALLEAQTRTHGHPIRVILYGQREIYVIESVNNLLPFAFEAIV